MGRYQSVDHLSVKSYGIVEIQVFPLLFHTDIQSNRTEYFIHCPFMQNLSQPIGRVFNSCCSFCFAFLMYPLINFVELFANKIVFIFKNKREKYLWKQMTRKMTIIVTLLTSWHAIF